MEVNLDSDEDMDEADLLQFQIQRNKGVIM